MHGQSTTSRQAAILEDVLEGIRQGILAELPAGLRSRYIEAAARVGPTPDPYPFRIRVADHRALFACVPDRAAKGAVRAYRRIRRDGL